MVKTSTMPPFGEWSIAIMFVMIALTTRKAQPKNMTGQQSAFLSSQGSTVHSRAEQNVREPEVVPTDNKPTDNKDTSTSLLELSAILIPILVGIAATLIFAAALVSSGGR